MARGSWNAVGVSLRRWWAGWMDVGRLPGGHLEAGSETPGR